LKSVKWQTICTFAPKYFIENADISIQQIEDSAQPHEVAVAGHGSVINDC